MGQSYIK